MCFKCALYRQIVRNCAGMHCLGSCACCCNAGSWSGRCVVLTTQKEKEKSGLISHIWIFCLSIDLCCAELVQRKVHPRVNVSNPIYEAGEDVYEEIPDLDSGKQKTIDDTTYTDTVPPLPTPASIPQNEEKRKSCGTTPLINSPKHDLSIKLVQSLNTPSSESVITLSALFGSDDTYTVMNPASNTVPQNQDSGLTGQRESLPTCSRGIAAGT